MTLTNRQLTIVIVAGVLFALADILCVRYLGHWVYDFGIIQILLYVLIIPISWITIWLIQKIADLSQDNLFRGMAIAAMTALLVHGVALTWFPGQYALSADIRLAGAASILWGAGVFLAVACWMTRAK